MSCRNDGPTTGYFITNEFRGYGSWDAGTESLACVLLEQPRIIQRIELLILPNSYEFHLRGNHALTGIVHLGYPAAGSCTARRSKMRKSQLRQPFIRKALPAIFGAQAVEFFKIVALSYPGFTNPALRLS